MSNQLPEQPPNQAQARSEEVTINIKPSSRREANWRKRALVASVVGAVAVGGLLYFNSRGNQQKITNKNSQVIQIKPIDLDCRAVTVAQIPDTASQQPKPGIAGKIPLIRTVKKVIDKSNGISESFRGTGGQGGGEVDTMACATSSGIHIRTEDDTTAKNPAQAAPLVFVNIPAHDIIFKAAINEDKSMVVPGAGILAAESSFEGTLLPFDKSLQNLKTQAAVLGQIARKQAVDTAVQTCGENAWTQTELAFQDGYRIAFQGQYNNQKALNPNVRPFDANKVTVTIDGTPDFTPPYRLPSNITHSFDTILGHPDNTICTVPNGLYQPANLTSSTPIPIR